MASADAPVLIASWPNAILHVDGDAFFASCEQALHPEYQGLPVITGQERNIVASMSYEAKALGIRRATPVWKARKICRDLIVLPSDYESYSLMSKRMFAIIRRFTPMVEESSIDEGFADLQGLRRLYRTGYAGIAENIQRTIEKEMGISVSMGLSLNKTLSKLAAKFKKPKGFTVVRGRHLHLFLAKVPVEDVCGIGPNTTALLHKRGVKTALEYVHRPELWVKGLWGKIGVELWHELRGEMVYALNPKEKTSYDSVSKTKTFTPPSDDYAYVKARLFRNAESAFIKLRRYRLRAKRMTAFMRTQDFRGTGVESDLSRATSNPIEAFGVLETMLKQMFRSGTLYRSTGIVLSRLEEDTRLQFELFESPVRMAAMRELGYSIDKIGSRYGKHAVCSGASLYLQRGSKQNARLDGRHVQAARKSDLLPGETFRRRVRIPLWKIRV